MLNKEFKRKDVERMRNLIKGDVDKSAELQVGYETKRVTRKEGDIWKEGGKEWTIKDGIKQTYTKLDHIKKEAVLPLFCPSCGTLMKKRNDSKMYHIHKKCFDCVVEFEHKLRIRGEYDDYLKNLQGKNNLTILDEAESYLLDAINTSNSQYVSEDGVVERWVGGLNKEKLSKELKQTVKETRKKIKPKLDD